MAIWSTHEKKGYHKMRIKHRHKWQVGVGDWAYRAFATHSRESFNPYSIVKM